jgi:hypothetical protein
VEFAAVSAARFFTLLTVAVHGWSRLSGAVLDRVRPDGHEGRAVQLRPTSRASRTALLALVAGTAIAAVVAAAVPTHSLDTRHTGGLNARGFPKYFTDNSGLSLRLCEDGTRKCLRARPADLRPPEGEALYWSASAPLRTSRGRLDVEFALEAAFGGARGFRPIVFDRLRIRGHLNRRGTYTLLHPYGKQRFRAVRPREQRNVDFTADRNCSLRRNGRCRGDIGHFLRSRSPQIGYLGAGERRTRITGGRARNSLILRAPNGRIIGRTSRFAVLGKTRGPAAVIPPGKFRFGPTATPRERNLRIRNYGRPDLDFSSIRLTGSDSFGIRRTESTCRSRGTVASARGCRIVLRFVPGTQRLSRARLVIRDNTVAGVHRVKLRGRSR